MKQKYLNPVLAAVAASLLALVYFKQEKDAAVATKRGEPLTTLTPAAVNRIVLRHPDAPEIVLEKKDAHWQLISPVLAPADAVEIDSLIALGARETRATLNPKQIARADLGLEPPAYRLTLNELALDFGGIEPLKYSRYVEVGAGTPADRIVLIDDPDASLLDADYADLVSKSLLPADADIVRVELPGLRVERSTVGPGWTSEPATALATSDNLQRFVDLWKQARSVSNVGVDAQASEPEPAVVSLKDGTTYRFLIVSRKPQLILERPDFKIRYRFASEEAERLLKLPVPPTVDTQPPKQVPSP